MTIGSTVALGVGILATAAVVRPVLKCVPRQAGAAPVAESDVRGLHLTAEVRLGALPPQSTYWHIYEFDSHAVAEAARPARGTVAELFGRHWLYGSECFRYHRWDFSVFAASAAIAVSRGPE